MTRTALFALALLAASCSHAVQSEVGTPAQRYSGHALVVLPRACITDRSVPTHHLSERPLEPRTDADTIPPAKTARLQALLDGLVPGTPPPIGPRPPAECEAPAGADLADVRATPGTLQSMRESGASHVVVLELHTVLACAQSRPWSPNDVCIEDEVTLSAWMFDERGVAVWGLTRTVSPTDEPGWVLDRVLDRVPTAEPLHRSRGEFEVASTPNRSPTL